jgi:hypothetical protein
LDFDFENLFIVCFWNLLLTNLFLVLPFLKELWLDICEFDICEFGVEKFVVDREKFCGVDREKFCGVDIVRPDWLIPLDERPDPPPPPPPRAKTFVAGVDTVNAKLQAIAIKLVMLRLISLGSRNDSIFCLAKTAFL